jgi:UDP-glucose 4-epimerase
MNVVITGAGGFIGKNLLLGLSGEHQLLALDRAGDLPGFISRHSLASVTAREGDLTDESFVKEAAAGWGEPEAVIYLAGNGDPAYSVTHPRDDLRDTVLGFLTFCRYFHPRRLIYFSSGAVYDGISGPVSPASRLDPRLPYAIGKLACEQYLKFFQRSGSLGGYLILRFFGAYGPYEPPRKIYTKLVRSFLLEKKREFTIRGDGKNLIDAMYAGDTVRALSMILRSDVSNRVVDLCVGQPFTIRELVEEAARVFEVPVEIKLTGEVPEYINFRPSPEEMKKLFGFSPRTPLPEGLERLGEFLRGREQQLAAGNN